MGILAKQICEQGYLNSISILTVAPALENTGYHCYSNLGDAYKALPHSPFDKSDQRWSDQSESMLQDCFDHADWDMFRVASENNINIYAESVSEFIRKCIRDVAPTVLSLKHI